MTPREEFVTADNLSRAYEWHYLNIGFGVTITGPHTVARMTNTLAVKPGDKVLEIGTGSGYQSAYLSYLTDKVWSIEIIPALAKRTRGVYDSLIARGYKEYAAIETRNADGYYGWPEAAPFDKIIVTCGIDHIPPPLLQQLKPDGIMVIPVGPPGAQHVVKAVKTARRRRLRRVALRHLQRRDHPLRALHRRPSELNAPFSRDAGDGGRRSRIEGATRTPLPLSRLAGEGLSFTPPCRSARRYPPSRPSPARPRTPRAAPGGPAARRPVRR